MSNSTADFSTADRDSGEINNKIRDALQKLKFEDEVIIELENNSIVIEKRFCQYNVGLITNGVRKDIAYNINVDKVIKLVNQYAS